MSIPLNTIRPNYSELVFNHFLNEKKWELNYKKTTLKLETWWDSNGYMTSLPMEHTVEVFVSGNLTYLVLTNTKCHELINKAAAAHYKKEAGLMSQTMSKILGSLAATLNLESIFVAERTAINRKTTSAELYKKVTSFVSKLQLEAAYTVGEEIAKSDELFSWYTENQYAVFFVCQ